MKNEEVKGESRPIEKVFARFRRSGGTNLQEILDTQEPPRQSDGAYILTVGSLLVIVAAFWALLGLWFWPWIESVAAWAGGR